VAKPRPRQNFRHYYQRQTWLKLVDFLALGFSTGTILEVLKLTKALISLSEIKVGAGDGNRTIVFIPK
jgi:hypothetical protein